MKWKVFSLIFMILGLAVNANANKLSGNPDFNAVISQPLSENRILDSVLVAVSASNYSNTLEHDELVSTLTSLGYGTVDVTTVADAQTANADVIMAYIGCYTFDIANLDNWISSGKGYIQIGDWTDWFTNSWEYVGGTNTVTVSITNPTHPIAQGLPSSWTGVGSWEYGLGDDIVGWTSGYTEVGKLQAVGYAQHDEGISATVFGSGNAVYLGFNVYGSSAGQNELTLLSNAINWVAGISLSPAVDITAVPNPTTVGGSLDILLDLANPGDGFDAKFRLWVLVAGNVTTLVDIAPFVDAGLVIDDFNLFSTPSVPAGLPPVVGFLAAIFNATSGEVLDSDMEFVGIGVAPDAADITTLRQAATDFLNSGAVNAAPPRPEEEELNFNGKAKNPFGQQVNSKGKLTTTWGRIKSQQ